MRILITGAAGGIGSATMAMLRDHDVVGLDVGDCDVRDQASVDTAVAGAIAKLGGLDVLINCAGLGRRRARARGRTRTRSPSST